METTQYVALVNSPGYLPDNPPTMTFESASDAWSALIADYEAAGFGWVPADEDDPEGPQDRDASAMLMDAYEDDNTCGEVIGVDGLVYTVDYAVD